jgi:hypothetical protein
MRDLFTDEFEKAKREWQDAKKEFDTLMEMYQSSYFLLVESQEDLNEKWDKFQKQQELIMRKNPHVSIVRVMHKEK